MHGLAFTAAWPFTQALIFGWWGRSPDGTIGGYIQPYRGHVRPAMNGVLPYAVAAVFAVVGGLALYIVLSVVIIIGGAIAVLTTGVSIPTTEFLYHAVEFAILYTYLVQEEIWRSIAESKWYLGYSMS